MARLSGVTAKCVSQKYACPLSRLLITALMPGYEQAQQCPRLLKLPLGLHFGAVVVGLKDMVESAAAALLLFFSPSQNSMAIITVGPAQPTPEDGFCVYVCVCAYMCVL